MCRLTTSVSQTKIFILKGIWWMLLTGKKMGAQSSSILEMKETLSGLQEIRYLKHSLLTIPIFNACVPLGFHVGYSTWVWCHACVCRASLLRRVTTLRQQIFHSMFHLKERTHLVWWYIITGNVMQDVQYLGYLTSEQALADYAELISYIKSTTPGASNSPVIVFGGSYGGMLAAWMRIKYPHIIKG